MYKMVMVEMAFRVGHKIGHKDMFTVEMALQLSRKCRAIANTITMLQCVTHSEFYFQCKAKYHVPIDSPANTNTMAVIKF